jgi:hypothetical protein
MNATCDQCGEENPADIHTCTPAAPVPTGAAPCAKVCEANAFQITIRGLKGEIERIKAAQPAPTVQEPETDWSKVAIDTPVWCRFTTDKWYPRHFAGTTAGGAPTAWIDGETSNTTGDRDTWTEMRLTKPAPMQEPDDSDINQIHEANAQVRYETWTPPAQPAPVQPVQPVAWAEYHYKKGRFTGLTTNDINAVDSVGDGCQWVPQLQAPPAQPVPVPDLTHDQWDQWQDKHGLILEREALSALRSMLYTSPAATPRLCTWTKSNDPNMPDTYEATCGAVWSFTEGGPVENNMRFCPECGKPAEQKGQS